MSASADSIKDQPSSTTFCPAAARIYVLVSAILASSMAFIDGSVISIAIPALRADLGATLADAQWISNSYLLFLASLLLIGGAAGDRFGLRLVFGLGIGLFVAASLVCAIAPGAGFLIIARAIQGIGAALMVPGSLAIIAKAYPREQRGWAIGIWASASSLTTILGPVIGGLVLTVFGDWSWRLVFAINLPLGIAALALLVVRVPPDPGAAGHRLDLPGGTFITLSLLLFALGLTGDGSRAVPEAAQVLIFCGAGLVLLLCFLVWEARAKEPMMPLGLFRNMRFSGANGLTFALYFSLSAVMFYLPMTMISGWGVSPATAAIASLPLGIVLTLMSSFSGRLADRVGPAPPIAGGSLLVGAAFAGLAIAAPLQSVWLVVMPLMTLMGIGMGFVVSPLSTAVMTSLSDAESGIASGVNNAVARVAGLLAVALMGSVAALVFGAAMGDLAGPAISFGSPAPAAVSAEVETLRTMATNAAFSAIAAITAVLCLVSAAIAWFTLERRLAGAAPAPN